MHKLECGYISGKELNKLLALRDPFVDIRNYSFIIYEAANKWVVDRNNGNYSITGLDTNDPTFTYQNAKFSILPIATACEKDNTVIPYGEYHPSGFAFNLLDRVINQFQFPTRYECGNIYTGATKCFRFCFKFAAVVCNQVQGITFMSFAVNDTSSLWVVLLKAKNKLAHNAIQTMNNYRVNITEDIINGWYNNTHV